MVKLLYLSKEFGQLEALLPSVCGFQVPLGIDISHCETGRERMGAGTL